MKIPSLLIDSSPSLLTAAAAAASVVVAGGRSCSVSLVRLSFTGAKLHELDRVTPVRAGKLGYRRNTQLFLGNLLSRAEFIRPPDP